MTISIDSIPHLASDTRHNGNGGAVEPWQRHKRRNPCRICGGGDDDKRGRGERCAGYISRDEQYEYCCNPDYAGNLQPRHTATGDTYKHKLHGLCNCGMEHGTAEARPTTPRATPEPTAEARKVYATIPDRREAYRLTATYEYRDASSTLRYVIARYEGRDAKGEPDKTLRPFCPVDGGWVMARAEVSLLYRLPDLLAADPWQPVYICEGEKDADRLASAGLIATTNAFGASSWSTIGDAPEILTGRHVVILEDNDKAGRDRTQAVAASLERSAANIRVMCFPDLPEGGDVSDWLETGHTVDELHRGCHALPVRTAQPQSEPSAAHNDGSDDATQDTVARLMEGNLRLNERIQRLRQIVTSPALTPTARVLTVYLDHEIDRAPSNLDADGKLTFYKLDEDAAKCGMKPSKFRKALDEVNETGIFHKGHVDTPKGNRLITVRPGPTIHTSPAEWPMSSSASGGGGGAREGAGRPSACPDCGSKRIRVTKKTVYVIKCQAHGCGAENVQVLHEAEVPSTEDTETGGGNNQIEYQSPQCDGTDYFPSGYETVSNLNVAPPETPDDALEALSVIPSLRIVNAPPTPLCSDCGGATWRDPFGRIMCRSCFVPVASAEAS